MIAVSSLILTFLRTGDAGFGPGNQGTTSHSRTLEVLYHCTELQVRDYDSLLRLGGDYRIAELAIEPRNWLDGRTLAETRPQKEGVVVLGAASAEGKWFGTPAGDTRLSAGETLIVYGRAEAIQAVEQRQKEAERDYEEAAGKQKQVARRERSEKKSEENHGR